MKSSLPGWKCSFGVHCLSFWGSLLPFRAAGRSYDRCPSLGGRVTRVTQRVGRSRATTGVRFSGVLAAWGFSETFTRNSVILFAPGASKFPWKMGASKYLFFSGHVYFEGPGILVPQGKRRLVALMGTPIIEMS